MAGTRQDQPSQEGQDASGKALGAGSLVSSSFQVERNTPHYGVCLGSPGTDRLGLFTVLIWPGSLEALVTTKEWS